jgi:ABC-2 type transport system ATP-binding protein
MPAPIISITQLQKKFGMRTVLGDVSLDIPAATIFGLVGLNGAGKTTLLRLLLGLLRPGSGTCRVLGMDPVRQARDYYRRIGAVLEHHGFNDNSCVRDNLHFFAQARGLTLAAADEYFEQWWRGTAIDGAGKVRILSRGQKMQCAICRAFLGWPAVYFFDEPVVALDMHAYDHFCAMARQARERGATIIISSHQLDAIEELCDTVGVLGNGTLSPLQGSQRGLTVGTPWTIAAANEPEYGRIITEVTGSPAQYADGRWQFTLAGSEERIPELIGRLVGQGCRIKEVRPDRNATLRESIRRHYLTQP